ncbi:hypothetical protein BFW01_g2367 [Lasiodiplodia theobromae]|uniref:Universal stress protein A family protein n=1 Tax=Lasiodiplodia theobromae TaxID=45133 RepID=A0A5N5DJJ1_9PEZI|nr:Universal stress protein [Lasiodiplodia theobromae]KAB2577072.1 Universal stress protein A family protein [Lasiodiplodia theobromae]KAF4543767.1 Universal stress protein [Lasiodiplodia theobromae]KAF9631505.1 hypothetical protein BFW01_g2367 [Lasiodiplodia theobromae]
MPHPTPGRDGAPSPTSPAGTPAAAAAKLDPLAAVRNQDAERRPSIQFLANQGLPKRSGSPKIRQRRLSSPPPPPVFQPRVSFDTFDKPADFIEENSFTLIRKHKDYEYTKRSRTFLCGLDSNDYSEYALEWLIDELVDDGDEIVCLQVVEKGDKVAGESSIDHGRYRAEAEKLMDRIQMKNTENKAVNLILEFSVGTVHKVIDEMINLHEPAILIVGTRGRSLGGFQGLLPGSVSKYCLQHSPVPVIVVRPTSKRAKTKRKRLQDPTRTGYRDLLDKSGAAGGHLLDTGHRHSLMLDELQQAATDEEAAAVAKAVGYNPPPEPSPLGQDDGQLGPQTPDSITNDPLMSGENSPDDARDDVGALMKSPELQNLDTPAVSSDEDSDDDDGGVQMFPPALQEPASQDSPSLSPNTTLVDESRSNTIQDDDSRADVSPGTLTPAVESLSVSDQGQPVEPASSEEPKEKS